MLTDVIAHAPKPVYTKSEFAELMNPVTSFNDYKLALLRDTGEIFWFSEVCFDGNGLSFLPKIGRSIRFNRC